MKEKGLLQLSRKSKFLGLTFLTTLLSYNGLRYMRDNYPEQYRSLVWTPMITKFYPFLLAITVMIHAINFYF